MYYNVKRSFLQDINNRAISTHSESRNISIILRATVLRQYSLLFVLLSNEIFSSALTNLSGYDCLSTERLL